MTDDLGAICCARTPETADTCERVAQAVQAGADVHAADKNGVTALHHAVRFRRPSAVQALIEHGADVNRACRRNGSTPLHRAVIQTGAPGTAGKTGEAQQIVRLLLAAGADPSIANKAGKRPIDYVTDDSIRVLLEPK